MADDNDALFDDHAAEQYLRELVEQASAGILAAQATRLAATGEAPTAGDVFVNARAVANAAAMISKILWPGQMRKAPNETQPQFERRRDLAARRGPAQWCPAEWCTTDLSERVPAT